MKQINILLIVVTLIFMTLKLAEIGIVKEWSWIAVLFPSLILCAEWVLIIILGLIVYFTQRKAEKKGHRPNERKTPFMQRLEEAKRKQQEDIDKLMSERNEKSGK